MKFHNPSKAEKTGDYINKSLVMIDKPTITGYRKLKNLILKHHFYRDYTLSGIMEFT